MFCTELAAVVRVVLSQLSCTVQPVSLTRIG